VDLARVFGYPVAAKLVSPKAVHKTEFGAVRLRLGNEEAVRGAFAELCDIARQKLDGVFDGVLIQPMVTDAVEVLVGLTQDSMFGPQVAFGLGGIHVELFRDVAFRTAPMTDRDADEMMRSVRGFSLLQGYRNQPAADVGAVHNLVLKLSFLGAQIPELRELEFNPVMVMRPGRGYQVVDARARVAPLAR
jgi:acyl-CoA synthetase (NDP forming)